jgi:outer membrane protein assembly factor BamB
VTVTGDEVLAVLNQTARFSPEMQFGGGAPATPERESRLVCLERETGKEKWVATPKQFPDQGNLRTLIFNGSPLVVGDTVYVTARGVKNALLEDCYVIALDLKNGKYRWNAYVASANSGNQIFGEMPLRSENLSHVAYASGRLFVLTNLGVVAAVDAYSGSVAWLNIYPRSVPENVRFNMGRVIVNGGNRPWTYNPALVQDGKVFALPADGAHVFDL